MLNLKLAMAVAILISASAEAQVLTNAPVTAPAEPFEEALFDTTISDPWRWMERAEREEDVRSFILSSSEHTTSQLARLPGRERVRERISQAMQAGVRFANVRQANGNLFYLRLDPEDQFFKLIVRGPDGKERILYDPQHGDVPEESGQAVSGFTISPNGRVVAFNSASGGGEVGSIRLIDVETGQMLPDRIEPVWSEFEGAWLDDGTIFYNRMTEEGLLNTRVFMRRLGTAEETGPLLGTGVAQNPAFLPQELMWPFVERSPNWVMGLAGGARPDIRLFVAERDAVLEGHPQWRSIAEYEDRITSSSLVGNTLFLIRNRDNPDGEILSIDLDRRQNLSEARRVLSAENMVFSQVVATESGLYVLGKTDGISRLLFLAGGQGDPMEVELPFQGSILDLSNTNDGQAVTFAISGWFTAPRWYEARNGRIIELGVESDSYSGIAEATQVQESATSADGTEVPMAILMPPGISVGRTIPVLLYAYGSYGFSVSEPRYFPPIFGFVEEGGAVVYCGTRGGGERGRSWHEAGRATNKPNAHADLVACGERLIQLGITSPGQLTVIGNSASGLVVPTAAMARPDLFGALVMNAGMLNPLRLSVSNNGPNQYGEMGDPTTEEGFKALILSDAYHRLLSAADIPDTLLTIGLNDRRVPFWESAKFAARARERFGSRRLVLMRTDPNAGHGYGSAQSQIVEQYADIFSFAFNRAGAEGFTVP